MLQIGDRVRVLYGVMYKGHDLTHEKGIVRSLESYVEVYLPSIGIIAKLFQHEVEPYKSSFDEITLEDIAKIFS